MLDEAFDVDVVADDFPRPRAGPVESHFGVEQAVDRQALGTVVDAEIAAKEQVGLPGLHGDAGGDAPRSRGTRRPGWMSCSVTTLPGGHATRLRPSRSGSGPPASAARPAGARAWDSRRRRRRSGPALWRSCRRRIPSTARGVMKTPVRSMRRVKRRGSRSAPTVQQGVLERYILGLGLGEVLRQPQEDLMSAGVRAERGRQVGRPGRSAPVPAVPRTQAASTATGARGGGWQSGACGSFGDRTKVRRRTLEALRRLGPRPRAIE